MRCRKRRINDQWHCAQCGLQWDVSDVEKPPCRPKSKLTPEYLRAMETIRRKLG
jgi:hypothetical protein